MLIEQPASLSEDVTELVRQSFVAQAQLGVEKDFVAPAQVLHIHSGQRPVGNGKLGSFRSANASGAEADVFHGADPVAETADVAHVDDFIREQGNASEEILQAF